MVSSVDVFAQCRAAVPAIDAAERYGFTPTRAGFISCPLPGHGTDSSPSLKFYPDGGFYCFGCNRGGSSIDFVAALFGLSALQAVKKLDQDFNLQLDIGKPMTPQELQEARQRAEQLQTIKNTMERFEAWRAATQAQLNAALRLVNGTLARIERLEDWDKLSSEQVEALRMGELLEMWCDDLFGPIDQQMCVFRERSDVAWACELIQKNLNRSWKCSRTA